MVKGWGALVVTTCVAGCIACGTRQEFGIDTTSLAKIGVEWALTEAQICAANGSPEVTLTDVPAAAVSYEVLMTDLDSPRFRHWRETFESQQRTIRAGKGTSYIGPQCPPNGHRYRIGVLVRDAQQEPVAYGEKTNIAARSR